MLTEREGTGIQDGKQAYREEILARRLRLSFEEVFEKSLIIQKRFLSIKEYRVARRIAIYASFKNEVITDEVFANAAGAGKEVFYPGVIPDKGCLIFKKVESKDDLTTGAYNILEPVRSRRIEPVTYFDIVVVPGVVFGLDGNRIGYGKGYYDMTLKDYKGSGLIVGFAYEMQVLPEIPCLPHDVGVDMLITEERVIRIGEEGRFI